MCLRKALCSGLLLVFLQLALCSPIAKNSTNEIVFKSINRIEVKGAKLSGLNCTLRGPLQKLCSYITEVTCKQEQNEIRSCLVSNKGSIFNGKSVEVQSVVCVDEKRTANSCSLLFRPSIAKGLADAMKFKATGHGVLESKPETEENRIEHEKRFKELEHQPKNESKNIRNDPFDDDPWFNRRRSKMQDDQRFFMVCFGIIFVLM